MLERWDNRLDFPPTEIAERYRRGDLAVLLDLGIQIGQQNIGIEVFAFACQITINDAFRHFQMPDREAENQGSVLILDVHSVKGEKWVPVRSWVLVRLKVFDEPPNHSIADSLYLSFISGNFVFRGGLMLKDWKRDARGMLSLFLFGGKHPDDVIQTRPKVMYDLTCQNTKTERDQALTMVCNCLLHQMHILVGERTVFPLIEKSHQLGIQVADVLVGPF